MHRRPPECRRSSQHPTQRRSPRVPRARQRKVAPLPPRLFVYTSYSSNLVVRRSSIRQAYNYYQTHLWPAAAELSRNTIFRPRLKSTQPSYPVFSVVDAKQSATDKVRRGHAQRILTTPTSSIRQPDSVHRTSRRATPARVEQCAGMALAILRSMRIFFAIAAAIPSPRTPRVKDHSASTVIPPADRAFSDSGIVRASIPDFTIRRLVCASNRSR